MPQLKIISNHAKRQNEERTLHGLPLITSVDWKLSPVFDAKTHTVEWAVLAKTQTAEVINHTMRFSVGKASWMPQPWNPIRPGNLPPIWFPCRS